MSEENRRVYVHCMSIADELVLQHRHKEADAVLRALQVYLDALPATSDGSCRSTTERKLEELSALIRIREKKKEAEHGL